MACGFQRRQQPRRQHRNQEFRMRPQFAFRTPTALIVTAPTALGHIAVAVTDEHVVGMSMAHDSGPQAANRLAQMLGDIARSRRQSTTRRTTNRAAGARGARSTRAILRWRACRLGRHSRDARPLVDLPTPRGRGVSGDSRMARRELTARSRRRRGRPARRGPSGKSWRATGRR